LNNLDIDGNDEDFKLGLKIDNLILDEGGNSAQLSIMMIGD